MVKYKLNDVIWGQDWSPKIEFVRDNPISPSGFFSFQIIIDVFSFESYTMTHSLPAGPKTAYSMLYTWLEQIIPDGYYPCINRMVHFEWVVTLTSGQPAQSLDIITVALSGPDVFIKLRIYYRVYVSWLVVIS